MKRFFYVVLFFPLKPGVLEKPFMGGEKKVSGVHVASGVHAAQTPEKRVE